MNSNTSPSIMPNFRYLLMLKFKEKKEQNTCRRVASVNLCYYLENQLFILWALLNKQAGASK